jgi:hypothetical protein
MYGMVVTAPPEWDTRKDMDVWGPVLTQRCHGHLVDRLPCVTAARYTLSMSQSAIFCCLVFVPAPELSGEFEPGGGKRCSCC